MHKKTYSLSIGFSFSIALPILLLIIFLIVVHPSLAADDPVIISVGTVEYPLSQVQSYLDLTVAEFTQMGVAWDEQDVKDTIDYVVKRYTDQGVLQNELQKRGLDKLTTEEEKLIEDNSQKVYNEMLQLYIEKVEKDYDRHGAEAQKYAEVLMGIDGITLEAAREQSLNARKEYVMLKEAAGDLTLSENEIKNGYQNEFVARDREKYANNIRDFEKDVIFQGEPSFYMPAGYRLVKQIILDLPATIKNDLIARNTEISLVMDKADEALSKLNRMVEIGGNVEKAQEEYDEANEEYFLLEEAYQTVLANSVQAQQETIDEIKKKYQNGESFDSLIQGYSIEKEVSASGLFICADSYIYDDAMISAAMEMKKPGDLSEPFATDAGVQILYYDSDIPEGAAELSGNNYNYIKEQLTQRARYAKLDEKIAEWANAYKITTNTDLLTINLPEF